MPSNIKWTQETWNPISGCTKISTGCRNCYAERMAKRLAGRHGYPEQPDHFKVTLHLDKLYQPNHWKKPRRIFVCSMGDLFHEDVSFTIIKSIWGAATNCPHHTFQILTKRPERMYRFTQWMAGDDHISIAEWPRNVWLGVTAENQEMADERIPWLLKTPAAIRFVSVEPMLGPVDLRLLRMEPCNHPGCFNHVSHPCEGCGYQAGKLPVDWVICGGETGPGAREMKWEWAESLHRQCQEANVPFFFKRAGDAFNGIDGLKAEALAWSREFPNPHLPNPYSLSEGQT